MAHSKRSHRTQDYIQVHRYQSDLDDNLAHIHNNRDGGKCCVGDIQANRLEDIRHCSAGILYNILCEALSLYTSV